MTRFAEWVDLAAERVGGAALLANDEFFAPKESLLRAAKPVFLEGKYTERGKWMDGWETRRRREPGHDWCIVRLGLPGVIRGVVVDTSHFRGNYPEACSLDGLAAPAAADPAGLAASAAWTELLGRSPLEGDAENAFDVPGRGRMTHVRLNIFPDGGVARLRVYGEVVPDWARLARPGIELDLAAVEHGGLVVAASDMFFGNPRNMIMPGPASGMSDGWETRRRRGPGNDWAVIRLGARGVIRRVEVDTSHFKGNAPGSCAVLVRDDAGADPASLADPAGGWTTLLPRTPLLPHTRHVFMDELAEAGPATHARLDIFPDGGVARLRLHGTVAP